VPSSSAPPATTDAEREPPQPERRGWRDRALRWGASTPFLAAVIALLAWPIHDFEAVGAGTDLTAIITLHMATERGLNYGTEVIFTYGPLGFLTLPKLSYPLVGALSLIYAAALQLALAATALWSARRMLPLPVALVVALAFTLLATLTGHGDRWSAALMVVVFAACLAAIRPDGLPPRLQRLFPFAIGAVAALEAMVKLNTGLTVLALALVAVAAGPAVRRRRALLEFGASVVIAGSLLWLVLGQSFPDIPAYVARSYDMITGYGTGFQNATEELRWHYWLFAPVAAVVAGVCFMATRGWPRRVRLAAGLLTALLLFAGWKQTVLRHGPAQASFFFVCAAGAVIALGWPERRRWVSGIAIAALLGVLTVVISPESPRAVWTPLHSLSSARAQFAMIRAPSEYADRSRQALRAKYGVSEDLLGRLRGKGVHVWPEEAGVVWAYPELRWRPLPVFQNQLAVRPALDEANADALASPDGPERVLRAAESQYPRAPAASLALLCNFRPVASSDRWEVLERTPDRCGRPRLIGSVRTQTESPVREGKRRDRRTKPSREERRRRKRARQRQLRRVTVPTARTDEAVFVRVHGAGPTLGDRGWNFLFKGPFWSLDLDGGEHQYSPETATHPLLLTVPSAANGRPPFQAVPGTEEIALRVASPLGEVLGDKRLWRRDVRLEFYAVRIAP